MIFGWKKCESDQSASEQSDILQLVHLRRGPSTLLPQPPFTNKLLPSKPYLLRNLHPHLMLQFQLQLRVQWQFVKWQIFFIITFRLRLMTVPNFCVRRYLNNQFTSLLTDITKTFAGFQVMMTHGFHIQPGNWGSSEGHGG